MLEGNLMIAAMALSGALAFGGLAYVFLDPLMSGERRTKKRMKSVSAGRGGKARNRLDEIAQQRRKSVQDSLKELEEQTRKQSQATLKTRLERAGIDSSVRTFYVASAIFGVFVGLLVFSTGVFPLVALVAAVAAGLGFPRWLLGFLMKRRQIRFLNEFANSLDIIVRGVKAGLPINDCLQMIAREAREPVASEFSILVESQKVGVPIEQGLQKMFERMPIAEVNFFAIVLSIQKSSGGNLAEVLGNLSKVLRDRKKMKAKVRALSQEAKSSAAIIGSLPIVVMLIVYLSSPDYITLLFTERVGNLMLVGGGLWMLCGIFVMKAMMDFEI